MILETQLSFSIAKVNTENSFYIRTEKYHLISLAVSIFSATQVQKLKFMNKISTKYAIYKTPYEGRYCIVFYDIHPNGKRASKTYRVINTTPIAIWLTVEDPNHWNDVPELANFLREDPDLS